MVSEMNGAVPPKSRRDRVAGLEITPGLLTQTGELLRRGDVLVRLGMCLAAALVMLLVTQAWKPPLQYREGHIPRRAIVAGAAFQVPDEGAVEKEKDRARRHAPQVYQINPVPLPQLRANLLASLAVLTEAKQFDEKTAEVWNDFLPSPAEETAKTSTVDPQKQGEAVRRQFESFRAALSGNPRLKYEEAVKRALAEFEERGLLQQLEDTGEEHSNKSEIYVYLPKLWKEKKLVAVQDVRIADVKPRLLANLKRELVPLEKEVVEEARKQSRQVYLLNPEPLVKLRARLKEALDTLTKSETLDEATAKLWREFQPKPTEEEPLPSPEEQQNLFAKFREALAQGPPRPELDAVLDRIFEEYEKNGLLLRLMGPDESAEGNQEEIIIATPGMDAARKTVKVSSVRLADIKPKLREALQKELKSLEAAARIFIYLERELPGAATLEYQPPKMGESPLAIEPKLAERTYDYLEDKLTKTLNFDKLKTDEVREAAAADVDADEWDKKFKVGEQLIEAGKTIGALELALLKKEHLAQWNQLSNSWVVARLAAVLGMYFALYTLCGFFVYYRYPNVLADISRLAGLLVLTVLTVSLCYLLDVQGAEMVPLLLFGMIVAIAYHQELALLLLAAVGLVVVLSLGQGLPSFVVLTAAGATAVLLLRRVRNRTKLIFVGAAAGLVAMLTTIGVAVVDGQSISGPLLQHAGMAWVWCLTAGFVMTGLLPFIEHIFGVLTEISLLELGDVAHPLLQELVRRAPGTYNHSINVASMAEAAAERIGAQGLLVRVGAYFHDIGKILKPQYFAENQQAGDNRHEALVPAMSTLIIIAHVKDGADLARQHHLPRPIIDFIQEHHGTTLVEYFFRRASQKNSDDPDAPEVDENAFRYPGPKPQSKEAGILMLADAVESASRVLVEPTPARIVNLVEQLTMNRLLDGQFDECGLTLQEVHQIQESLVKSLTAVYHGRVKYPEPVTA